MGYEVWKYVRKCIFQCFKIDIKEWNICGDDLLIYFNVENGGKRFVGYYFIKIYVQCFVCGSQLIVEYCLVFYDLEFFGIVLLIIINIECNKILIEIVKVIIIE